MIVAAIGAVAIGFITALVLWDLFGQLQLPLGVAGHVAGAPRPKAQRLRPPGRTLDVAGLARDVGQVRAEVTTRDLTTENFKRTVYGNDNVLVYFWAPLCVPCDTFSPTYDASSEKHPDIVHGKVNLETEQELVGVAQVRLLPTLMAFRKGNPVVKQAGIANPSVMDDLVRHLSVYKVDPAAVRRDLI